MEERKLIEEPAFDLLYTDKLGVGSKSLVERHFLCNLPMDPVIFRGAVSDELVEWSLGVAEVEFLADGAPCDKDPSEFSEVFDVYMTDLLLKLLAVFELLLVCLSLSEL